MQPAPSESAFRLRDAARADLHAVRALYLSAFPREERPPFLFAMNRVKKRRARLLVAERGGAFIGFCYLIAHRDLCYLFLLAVAPESRGAGIGSRILQALLEEYRCSRVFLAREPLDDTAPNRDQRESRRAFYLKNGFRDLPLTIRELGVDYDTMAHGDPPTPKEYRELLQGWAGRALGWLFTISEK